MRVSVVIPVKNRREVVKRALASVDRQSLRPMEVLVVDDGSTDGTAEEVERFCQEMGNVRVIRHSQSRGAPAARNTGLECAKGDLIAFLDSDDEWEVQKLELQNAFLAGHRDYCACFCHFKHHHPVREYLSGVAALDVTEEMLFARNVIGSTSTALIRREALLAVGGFDEALPSCQDWDLWLKIAQVGRLHILAEPLLVYHYDESNRISHNHGHVMEGLDIVFERILRRAPDQRSVRAQHRMLLAALHTTRWPNWRKVVSYGLEGLALSPSLSSCGHFARNVGSYLRHKVATSRMTSRST